MGNFAFWGTRVLQALTVDKTFNPINLKAGVISHAHSSVPV